MYEDNDFMYEDETIQYNSSHYEQQPLKKGHVMVEIITILKSLINIADIISEHINGQK